MVPWGMEDKTPGTVTLEQFAASVDCHFTTASRLKSGERLPGRELLGRIIKVYSLDPTEALTLYTAIGKPDSVRKAFGDYLTTKVFKEAISAGSDS